MLTGFLPANRCLAEGHPAALKTAWMPKAICRKWPSLLSRATCHGWSFANEMEEENMFSWQRGWKVWWAISAREDQTKTALVDYRRGRWRKKWPVFRPQRAGTIVFNPTNIGTASRTTLGHGKTARQGWACAASKRGAIQSWAEKQTELNIKHTQQNLPDITTLQHNLKYFFPFQSNCWFIL